MVDTEKIYKGDLVRINADGEWTSSGAPAAGDMFAGIAIETVDNTVDGHNIEVDTKGIFQLTLASAAQADVGTLVYGGASDAANDQQSVYSSAGTHSLLIGAVVGLGNIANSVRVKILPLRYVSA